MWQILPLNHEDAAQIVTWAYPAPYEVYSLVNVNPEALLNPAFAYRSVRHEGRLVGYFCVGEDARVPGGAYAADALDLGVGLCPDLTGRGFGSSFFGAVLGALPGGAVRLTVAAFNERALRLYRRFGFEEQARFTAPNGRTYVVMTRPPGSD